MITRAMLQGWTKVHANGLARVHELAARCLDEAPLTAECTQACNAVNLACAELHQKWVLCQRIIAARYDQSALEGRPKPADAQDAVAHLKILKDLVTGTTVPIKAQCRRWCDGTWDMSPNQRAERIRANKEHQ